MANVDAEGLVMGILTDLAESGSQHEQQDGP